MTFEIYQSTSGRTAGQKHMIINGIHRLWISDLDHISYTSRMYVTSRYGRFPQMWSTLYEACKEGLGFDIDEYPEFFEVFHQLENER